MPLGAVLQDSFIVCVSSDIRELIQVDDVMEDDSLRFGPNGGLVFCMEYFANNFDWLEESLGHVEDDYILFDCPGTHRGRSMLKPVQEEFIQFCLCLALLYYRKNVIKKQQLVVHLCSM